MQAFGAVLRQRAFGSLPETLSLWFESLPFADCSLQALRVTCANCLGHGIRMFRRFGCTVSLWLLLGPSFAAAQGYFAGTVVDANNLPLAGATVQAGHATGIIQPWQVDGQAVTDAQGHYAITTLAAGDGSGNYILIARAPGRVSIVYPDTPCYYAYTCPSSGFAHAEAVPNLDANFQLQHPASISGRVSRADTSGPVIGATVFLSGGALYPSPTVQTDADGNFQFQGLLPDRYQVEVGFGQVPDQFVLLPQVYAAHDYDLLSPRPAGDELVLSDGQNATGIDFPLNPGATILGRVSGMIGRAISTDIAIRRLTPIADATDFRPAGRSGRYAPSELYPPAPGEYGIQPLFPGTFEIRFGGGVFSTEYYQHALSEAQALPVSLTGWQTQTEINGVVVPNQSIWGHITDAATGNPVVNAIVHGGPALPGFGTLLDVTDTLTDSSGAYTLEGLAPGATYVWVTRDPDYIDQVYPNVLGCCFAGVGTQPVQLGANQIVFNIDMALTAGASLMGNVFDADTGATFANMAVILFDANGHQAGGAYTNAGGGYLSPTVATGSYYVAVVLKQGYYYYPNYICPFTTTCDLNNAQLLAFSAPQRYALNFPIAHLDRIFLGTFE